ncbi:MAG: DMT family transporter [Candidatus Thorarchaeota archaeon]|jgi:drug/metabolite transporter (DMT)-like permease
MQTGTDIYALGVLSAFGATLLFGITNVIYKKLDKDLSALDITFTRVWVSLLPAFLFAVVSAGTLEFEIPPQSMLPLAISMILGIVAGDTVYFLSQERIGVARAFPIAMSYPLVVYFLAALFLNEPVIIQRVFGAILVVVGVAAIARAESSGGILESELVDVQRKRIGVFLAFLTVCLWALSDVIFQFGLTAVGAAEANFFRILIASIVLIPIFFLKQRGGISLPGRRVTIIALLTGLLSIALSLILYSYAVKFVGATITSVIIASAPIFTAPISAIYLKEEMSVKVVGGTLLTIAGVILVVLLL